MRRRTARSESARGAQATNAAASDAATARATSHASGNVSPALLASSVDPLAAMGDESHSPGAGGATSGEDASLVKKRRTKNFKWREDMAKKSRSGVGIVTRVPPLEPVTFASWDEFIRAWTEYMVQTKTLYRRRSSCSTASWNSKNRFKTLPVPDSFPYATMAYWCTHGCIQPSRGTGVRAHLHNRFTGCTARVTADVVYEKIDDTQVRWFIRVRNQISQHNHRISDEIFNCYSNNSSVPDEMLLGPSEDSSPRQHELAQPDFGVNGDFAVASADAESANSGRISDPSHAGSNASFITSSVLTKEVLADDQKISMARSELQPLLDELQRTPSRVIHKRLQDVSEFVMHLVSKWEQDRVNEDRHLHFIAQSAANIASSDQQRLGTARVLLAAEYGGVNGVDGHGVDNRNGSPQQVDSGVI